MKRTVFEDEHRWFRDSVAEFVARRILPERDRHREQRAIPRELWLEAGRQGFLGLGVAAEYGGIGCDDFRFNAVLGEELARAGLAYASAIGIQTDTVAPYLVELTTDEQKERWLPGLVSGSIVTAIGMTEPDAGSDLAALRTSASRNGAGWILSGAKTFITNGYNADLVIVAARTSGSRGGHGITLFAVENGMPGFTRGEKLHKVGQPEADTAELFFDSVEIPPGNMIGELDRGFVHMMERLSQERLSAAIACLGHAASVVDLTLEYIKERHAFGQPVGSFQHNRFVVAELVTHLDILQAYLDRCVEAHVARELTAIDAAKAKWWSAELQNRVIDACVQLHGGYGYMREYEVAQAWMDARVTKVWAGSNEIMKEVIGRSLGLAEAKP